MAAEEVGMVSSIPIITEITIPITKGVALVAAAISCPSPSISQINGYAANTPAKESSIAPRGTIRISSLVLPAYKPTISTTSITTT